jgi:hypothetical protein
VYGITNRIPSAHNLTTYKILHWYLLTMFPVVCFIYYQTAPRNQTCRYHLVREQQIILMLSQMQFCIKSLFHFSLFTSLCCTSIQCK